MNETTTLHEGFITTKEAARLFRYTSSYIAHLVRTKKINARRLGRSWLIEQNSLEYFVAQQRSQKPSNKRHTPKIAKRTLQPVLPRIQEQQIHYEPQAVSVTFSSAEPHTITTHHSVYSYTPKSNPSKWIDVVFATILIIFVAITAEFITITLQSHPVFSQSVGTLQSFPAIIGRAPLALGEFVIFATHAVIEADVTFAYGIAVAVPAIAYVTMNTFVGIGDDFSIAVARIPVQVASVFAHGTQ